MIGTTSGNDMPVSDANKRKEYKFRIFMSLGVLGLVGIAVLRTEIVGPGFWEMVLIGSGFAVISIAHSGWAIWTIDYCIKRGQEQNFRHSSK